MKILTRKHHNSTAWCTFGVASAMVAAGCLTAPLAASGEPARSLAQAASASTIVRPAADVRAFSVVPSGSSATVLADRVSQPHAVPRTGSIKSVAAGNSTAVKLATTALHAVRTAPSQAWVYARTGAATTLRIEVLWNGAVRAAGAIGPRQAYGWHSVAFTPPDQRAVDDLQLRFTTVGGADSQVEAAYVRLGRRAHTSVVLRPNADVPRFAVLPSGTAAAALADPVRQPAKVAAGRYLSAASTGASTTVVLADADLAGGRVTAGRAWVYGGTARGTQLRVEVVWGGSVHASTVLPARSGLGWRSVPFTPPTQAAVNDLQLRFTALGGTNSTIRAAYVVVSSVNDNAPQVNRYLGGLSPITPGPEQNAHPTGATQALPVTDPLEDPADPKAPSGKARYSCTTTPYSLAKSPAEIVTVNPDSSKLWLGGLLQGQGYAQGLGSLRELPIRKRAPLKIYIDLLGKNNSVTVNQPDAAAVQDAIGGLVQRSIADNVPVPFRASYSKDEMHSSSESLLNLGFSAKYMGAAVNTKLDVQHSANQSSLLVSFVQRMFTVSIVQPATPAGYFSADFTKADLDEQVAAGRIAPDNPPVVVSNISYGRTLIYSVTATATSDELSGALDAAYDGGAASTDIHLSDRQKTILSTATIRAVPLGGNEDEAVALLRTHRLGDYFAGHTSPATAIPISYQVDNVVNGSAAKFTETADYNLTECHAIPNHEVTIGAHLTMSKPQMYLEGPRSPAQAYGNITVNGAYNWSRPRSAPQEVNIHTVTDFSPELLGPGTGQSPWPEKVDWRTGSPSPFSIQGSINCKLNWWEFGDDPSNQYNWSWQPDSGQLGDLSIDGGSQHCRMMIRTAVTSTPWTEWQP